MRKLCAQSETTLAWLKRTDASHGELSEEMRRLTLLLNKLNLTFEHEEEEGHHASGGAGAYRTKIEDID